MGSISKRKVKLILSLLSFAFLSALASIQGEGVSVFIANALWFLIGRFLIKISFPQKIYSRAIRVFIDFMSIYLFYTLLASILYVDDPYTDFFYQFDSIEFYTRIDGVIRHGWKETTWGQIFYEARHWKGLGVISGFLGYLGYALDGHNSLILQKTQVVFVCALSIVYTFSIARIYLPTRSALKLSYLFGLVGHVFISSGALSRDVHILLLFTIAFYVFCSKWSVRGLLLLIMLGFLTSQFRLQHGFFFLVIISFYGWLGVRQKKNIFISGLIGISLLLGIAGTVISGKLGTLNGVQEKVEHYQDYHGEKFAKSSGLTSITNKFPPQLMFIPNLLISQTYPYPMYRAFYDSVADDNQYLKFPLVLSEVFWIGVWCVIIVMIFNYKGLKRLPLSFRYALFVSAILLIAVSFGSYEFRRMMCVYPVIFLSAAMLLNGYSKKFKSLLIYRVVLVYVGLFALYVVVRGF